MEELLRYLLLVNCFVQVLLARNMFSFFWLLFVLFPVLVFVFYVAYYVKYMISPVELHFVNSETTNGLVERISLLKEDYWPTPWIFNAHLQPIVIMKFRKKVNPCYRREIIVAEDGATLELDWGESDGPPLTDKSPVICLLSGITGNSGSSYIQYLMIEYRKKGYRPVIMNYPNANGTPMTSPRFFCLDSLSDTREFIGHTHSLYPAAKKIGIGFSLGGHFMIKYVQEMDKPLLSGCMVLSAPFSSSKCVESWEGKFKGGFIRNQEVFRSVEGLDHDSILKSRNMDEFNRRLSMALYKAKSMSEYHQFLSCDHNIKSINVPTLAVHAWDDPMIPRNAVPLEDFKSNPNCIFATTKTGGHTGWVSGFAPWKRLAWCEELVLQFTDASLALEFN